MRPSAPWPPWKAARTLSGIWRVPPHYGDLAHFQGQEFQYLMKKHLVIIRRNLLQGSVDETIGHSSFTSLGHHHCLTPPPAADASHTASARTAPSQATCSRGVSACRGSYHACAFRCPGTNTEIRFAEKRE